MANNTRSVEMQREIDNLKEQLQNSLEGMHRAVNEIHEQQAQFREEMSRMFATMAVGEETVRPHRNQHGDEGKSSHQKRTNIQQFSRMQRLEFPRFAGEDLKGWLFRCEQFFDVDETSEEDKIKIASLHLEGRALQWHQIYLKSRLTRALPRWEEYIQALSNRFGSALYEDPMAELMNLRQTGSVQSYLDSFDELLNRVELNEQYAVSCFLSGLKDEIEVPIRMFMPRTLQKAVSLAKLQEQSLNLSRRNFFHTKPPPILSEPPFSKSLAASTPYSQCSRPSYSENFPKECEEDGVEESNVDVCPQISMNAMAGIYDYKTMRVTGSVKGKAIHILIDTGSTHNFVDTSFAKQTGCSMEAIPPFSVTVADGNKIYGSYMCKGLCWKLQGVSFNIDVLAVPLRGCDLVLGVQWLVQLGDINWNFDQLKMEFKVGGRNVSLRGKNPVLSKAVDQEKMTKTLPNPGQIASLHLGLLHNNEEMMKQLSCVFKKHERGPEKELQQLLKEFWCLFEGPKHQEWQWLLADIGTLIVEPNSFGQGTKDYYCIALRERHHTYEYHVFKARFSLEGRTHISIPGYLEDWFSGVRTLAEIAKINDVFHVLQVKQHHGSKEAIPKFRLPYILLEPECILDIKVISKNNRPITQVLVKWFNTSLEDST